MSVVIEDLKVDEAPDVRGERAANEGLQAPATPALDERRLREILAREAWRAERLAAD